MKIKKLFIPILSLSLTFLHTGCSEDGNNTPKSTTSLNENQRNTVAGSIGQGIGFSLNIPMSQLINLTVTAYDEAIDITENCEISGSYTLKGSSEFDHDETINTVIGTTQISQTFTNCVVSTLETQDQTMQLNGTVQSEIGFDLSTPEGELYASMNASSTGSLDVSGDNVESGTCVIDLNASAEYGDAIQDDSASYFGKICDEDLSYTEIL